MNSMNIATIQVPKATTEGSGIRSPKCQRLQDKYYNCLEKNPGEETVCRYWLNSWETCQHLCKGGYGNCQLYLEAIAKKN